MKYSVAVIFAFALAGSWLSDCQAAPQIIIPSSNCIGGLPEIDLAVPGTWAPWVSNYIGQTVLGSIPVPVNDLYYQLSAYPDPNLGILINELLELIGIESLQLSGAIPLSVANTPFNIGSFQNYLNPSLGAIYGGIPIGSVPLPIFADSLSQYLAEEVYCGAPYANINGIAYL